MRRALVGTLAGWLAGAAGVMAQSPLPPVPPGYANYAPARGPQSPPYGPMTAPTYGPAYGPASGPVMTSGGAPMAQPSPAAPMADPRVGPSAPPAMQHAYPAAGPVMVRPGGEVGPNGWMAAPGPWGGGWGGCGDYGNGCWGGDCGGCAPCWGNCPWGAPCGPAGRMWASAELLLWWTRGQNLPPLVTAGTGPDNPGIIGLPGTVVLYGNQQANGDMSVGVRGRAGFWIDECRTLGLEGSGFYLGRQVDTFRTAGLPGDVISRPFFNTDPAVNAPDAELVRLPGVLAGDVAVTTTRDFYGADANIRRALCCTCTSRIDLVAGFRYLHLGDSLVIQETLTNLDPARGVVGEGFIVRDSFAASNNFYGGQLGLAGEFGNGQWFLDWRTLFALGGVSRNANINGTTTFLDPVTPLPTVTQPGGLLAQPSNIGPHPSAGFSWSPEISVNLGYAVRPGVRVFVGYTFIYWTNIIRAAEQVNLNVDATQLPTRDGPGVGTDPTYILRTNDFWAQGISFGLQLRY